ncbi:hypothetical protein PTKIN_Ptkin12aG0208200 [Pterospermum kingtungense]
MKVLVISALVVLAMVQLMKPGEAVISCQDVNQALAPCVPYLTSGAGAPATSCCAGVQKIKDMAVSVADKQAACNCVKDAAARIPTIKEDAAAGLPAKCNVPIEYPISKSTNCQE